MAGCVEDPEAGADLVALAQLTRDPRGRDAAAEARDRPAGRLRLDGRAARVDRFGVAGADGQTVET